jgi:hypothetical protein
MSSAHVANEAANAVSALIKMQRRMSVAVRVVFRAPALSFAVMDSQSERAPYFQHRNVFFHPSDIERQIILA